MTLREVMDTVNGQYDQQKFEIKKQFLESSIISPSNLGHKILRN